MICDALKITYTELRKQPAWWVTQYKYYLAGKNKAEEFEMKKSQKK